MTHPTIYRLPSESLSVCKVVGEDAIKILNNLTTQAIAELKDGDACETFVTHVRGKTLGHGFIFRQSAKILWFLGAANTAPDVEEGDQQSSRLAQQVEKYTIREDAMVENCDDQYEAFVIPPEAKHAFTGAFQTGWTENPTSGVDWAGLTSWCGVDTGVLVVAKENAGNVEKALSDESKLRVAGERDFHDRRIEAGFPWYHIDLDEKNLPQEMGRDDEAISFTKGCYLGQEIIAIMDARRQVQRLWLGGRVIEGTIGRGDLLVADGSDDDSKPKTSPVIRVTSASKECFRGFVRRSHFDPGSRAKLVTENGEVLARVEITSGE